MSNRSNFTTKRSASALKIDRNHYFISVQEISQDNGGSSEHLVLKKQKVNEDESPQGVSKQLFIPINDASEVLKKALDFLEE